MRRCASETWPGASGTGPRSTWAAGCVKRASAITWTCCVTNTVWTEAACWRWASTTCALLRWSSRSWEDIKRLMVSLRRLQKQNTDVLEELGLCYDGHSPQNSAGALSVHAFVQFVASVDRFTLQTAEAQHNHFNVKLQKDTHIT